MEFSNTSPAIWDNRCTFHRATFDYMDLGERYGNRAVGIGEVPYFDPHSQSRAEALGQVESETKATATATSNGVNGHGHGMHHGDGGHEGHAKMAHGSVKHGTISPGGHGPGMMAHGACPMAHAG